MCWYLESRAQTPRLVYELEDLRGESIVGQYHAEELTPVKIKKGPSIR